MARPRRLEITSVLRRRLLVGRHLGLLTPGSRLPSVRRLATTFETGQRVVMAAYRELELEGLVELRPRSGIFLRAAEDTAAATPVWLASAALPLLAAAIRREMPAGHVPDHLRAMTSPAHVSVACVECNDDHSDALCTELTRDYGVSSTPVPLDETQKTRTARARHTGKYDLVVTTAPHAAAVRAFARLVGAPLVSVSMREDLRAELDRLLGRRVVFFVGTDVRYETKLRQIFTGRRDRLRVCILGRDDPERIPRGAPVFAMERAWRALEGWSQRDRITPIRRLLEDVAVFRLLALITPLSVQSNGRAPLSQA